MIIYHNIIYKNTSMQKISCCCMQCSGCVQWVWLVGTEYQLHLLAERLVAIGHPHIGDVGASDVIAGHALLVVVLAQPVLLHLRAGRGGAGLGEKGQGGEGQGGEGQGGVGKCVYTLLQYTHTNAHTGVHT